MEHNVPPAVSRPLPGIVSPDSSAPLAGRPFEETMVLYSAGPCWFWRDDGWESGHLPSRYAQKKALRHGFVRLEPTGRTHECAVCAGHEPQAHHTEEAGDEEEPRDTGAGPDRCTRA